MLSLFRLRIPAVHTLMTLISQLCCKVEIIRRDVKQYLLINVCTCVLAYQKTARSETTRDLQCHTCCNKLKTVESSKGLKLVVDSSKNNFFDSCSLYFDTNCLQEQFLHLRACFDCSNFRT